MRKLIFGAALLAAASSASIQAMDNPFLSEYRTIYQIPPFEQIRYEHYLPALEAGIAEQKSNVDGITANREAATFENTILALRELCPDSRPRNHRVLQPHRIQRIAEFDEISATFIPRYSQHSDDVMMNDALFARVKAVYDKRDALDSDQRRLVEDYYKRFTRNGALLDPAQKAELKEINTRLADLFLKFNKNLLDATNSFEIVVDNSARLSGLPQSSIDQAADEAKARGKEGKYVFTLHAPLAPASAAICRRPRPAP